jgi:hypothetical protein
VFCCTKISCLVSVFFNKNLGGFNTFSVKFSNVKNSMEIYSAVVKLLQLVGQSNFNVVVTLFMLKCMNMAENILLL